MADAVEEPTGIVVQATRATVFASTQIGIVAVVYPPLRGAIGLAGGAYGIEWEVTQTLAAGQEVLGNGTRFRVTSVIPGYTNQPGDYGAVGFEIEPGKTPWPAAAVVLPARSKMVNDDSGLRLDGPDVMKATEVRALAWLPDAVHPTAVDVEWWPGKFAREGIDPAEVRTARLTVGVTATFGRATAKVLAVQGESADHPARVVMELLPRAGP